MAKNHAQQTYRGFKLEAKREQALGGWDNLYFSAYRISDGWGCIDSFTCGDDSVDTILACLRDRIDEAYETGGASECWEDDWLPEAPNHLNCTHGPGGTELNLYKSWNQAMQRRLREAIQQRDNMQATWKAAEQERDVLKRRLERDFECICCNSESVYNEAEDRWVCACEPSPQAVAMARAEAAEAQLETLKGLLETEQAHIRGAEALIADLEARLSRLAHLERRAGGEQ